MCLFVACYQVSARGNDGYSVHLGAHAHPPQAQLMGYKMHTPGNAKRANDPAQSGVYVVEWRPLDAIHKESGAILVIGEETMPGEHKFASSQWTYRLKTQAEGLPLIVASQKESHQPLSLAALDTAMSTLQAQASLTSFPEVRLLTNASRGQVGAWGVARSARLEASLPVQCIDSGVNAPLMQNLSPGELEGLVHPAGVTLPRLSTVPNVAMLLTTSSTRKTGHGWKTTPPQKVDEKLAIAMSIRASFRYNLLTQALSYLVVT